MNRLSYFNSCGFSKHSVRAPIAASLVALLIVISCAKIVAPPGGPEDKDAPVILSSEPHNLATKLGPEGEFTIFFSEPLANRGLENLVFVSPRQSVDPTVKVKGKRLVVSLADTLVEDQTYVLTLSAQVADLRGNNLGESRSYAFTRGDHSDTGQVSGVVTDNDMGAAGISVALYKDFLPDTLGDMDSLQPNYFTTSGDGGDFKFEYLPPAKYFLLAFKDTDKDQFFLYGVNSFALGASVIDLTGNNPKQGGANEELRLQSVDTSSISVLSVTNSDDELLKVTLSRSIQDSVIIENFQHMYLSKLDDSSSHIPIAGIRSLGSAKSSKYACYAEGLKEGEYSFTISFDSFYVDGRGWKRESFTPFVFAPVEDSTIPVVLDSLKAASFTSWQTANWSYRFSEPVLLDSSQLRAPLVAFDNGSPARYTTSQPDPFTIACQTTDALIPGENYTFTLPYASIIDLSGNTFSINEPEPVSKGNSDSTETEVPPKEPITAFSSTHRAWPKDSLGSVTVSIRSNQDSAAVVEDTILQASTDTTPAPVSVNNSEYELTFRRLPNELYELRTRVGDSLKVELPAGDYVIEVRLMNPERTDTQKRFDGSLYPLRWADKRSFYPDTVRIRPRFDSDKITVVLE